MSLRSVRVTVSEFRRCRRAHGKDFDVEAQIHARQRMIRIQQNLIALDARTVTVGA